MQIQHDQKDDSMIIRCVGRLDASTSVQLENDINSVIDGGTTKVHIDFNQIDYLSSAGMRLLLSASKRLKEKGGKLVIFSLHEDVMEIIRMAGFDKILQISPDEASALSN